MRYHHFEMLPEDAFQHCGNRKIQLHGGGNPFSFIGDAISSIGNAFEDVIGAVGDGLAGLDDWVREEIPGGWLLPVAAVAAVATGGGSLVALGEAAAVEGGAAAAGGVGGVAGATASSIAGGTLTAAQAAELAGLGASSVTSSVGAANLAAGAASGAYGSTVASLVAAGMPASMAMALPSVSTLASNAAVNAAMQMATTGKVNVDSLVKSLAMGSVSSVAGAGVSSAVGSLGIDNPLLASIANSAAQGATGAALSGRNPVTAALASALAGGVGFATQSSGLSQTAINSTVNALASGQSVQNALISAAIATGSSAIKSELKGVADKAGNTIKDQIKGFFVDIGTAQGKTADEVGTAFENMCTAKTEENKFITGKQEEFTQDQATIDGNKDKIDAFQELRGTYDSKIESYERNKELATNTAAYDAEMRSRGYEQSTTDTDVPDRWIKKTGGHNVWNDEANRFEYVPDSRYEDSDSIQYEKAPTQDSFIAAANADVREANTIGEQLNTAYTGKAEDIAPLQNAVTEKEQAYQNKSAAVELPEAVLTRMGYEKLSDGDDGYFWGQRTGGQWKDVDDGDGGTRREYVPDRYDEDYDSRKIIRAPSDLISGIESNYSTATAEANAAKAELDDAKTKLATATKTNDIIGKYGVADAFAANKRINDNLALYKDLSTATTTALTTLNGFVPPEKLSETIQTEINHQTNATTTTTTPTVIDNKDGTFTSTAADGTVTITGTKTDVGTKTGVVDTGTGTTTNTADTNASVVAGTDTGTKTDTVNTDGLELAKTKYNEILDGIEKSNGKITKADADAALIAASSQYGVTADQLDGFLNEGGFGGTWGSTDTGTTVVNEDWKTNPITLYDGANEVPLYQQTDGTYKDAQGNVVDVSGLSGTPVGGGDETITAKTETGTETGTGTGTETGTITGDQGRTGADATFIDGDGNLVGGDGTLVGGDGTITGDQGRTGTDATFINENGEIVDDAGNFVGCQLPYVDDGTGRCILPEDKVKEDTSIPDCGPGMVWSLTDNACVPVADVTKPVVTPITPKPPVTPPVVPVKPVVPTTPNTAVNPAQTQQNQQNALLMGLLLGQQQQAPQQQQPASLVKIDKPFDWNQDILGAADYEKATQRPYAAGGSVHSINDELIKLLRS